ncbi:MAG: hypothetical protein R6V34_06970 [Bacteroidales bacterium]
MRSLKLSGPVIYLVLLLIFASCGRGRDEISNLSEDMFENLNWRTVGPGSFGGRISEILVHPDNDSVIYVSPSTGGIFKSVNACIDWTPVFDEAGKSIAIGDMDISAKNPDLLWAGTGEASGEQNPASVGDGIYKSIDGGKSWENMGLKDSRHFSKVVIHPDNDNMVFAGATGTRWGACEERGLYRTDDGGKSWEKVLYINDNTGIGDIAVHPDGQTVLATTWEQRRNAWAHVQQAPGSGLYRSADKGDSWEKIKNGLPAGKAGRIALAVAPSNPDIVYACMEHDSVGLFRSEDKGITWESVNEDIRTSYWYGRIYVDPTDEDHLWVMGVLIQESFDGGRSFEALRMRGVHVDHHVLWVDPENTSKRLLGNDGGLYTTSDGGDNWEFIGNLPIGQYYNISVDNSDPYRIYGGLQDNGVWCTPSRSPDGEPVTEDDIISINGGDGFYSDTEPEDPSIVYGESQFGNIVRYNHDTGERERIKPGRDDDDHDYRFNWNTPFFVSSHKPHSLYIGAERVLKTDNRGEEWYEISGDLSTGRRLDTLLVIGQKPVLKPYRTITALAESELKKGLLYAGTDDGRLHVSRDDGDTWEDLTSNIPAPEDRFFTRIVPSQHEEARVYIGFGRFYEASDLSPYLFVSNDYGMTWTDISSDMPEKAVIRGFAEHPENPDLLFAGVHNGLFVSLSGGSSWSRMHGDMPFVAVDDIEIQERENSLVLGTYGRGLWILDNISFLSALSTDSLGEENILFEPVYLESTVDEGNVDKGNVSGTGRYSFIAPEPEEGINIFYYLRDGGSRGSGHVPVLTISDEKGNILLEEKPDGAKGFNSFVWKAEKASPGKYTISLETRRKKSSRTVTIPFDQHP